MRITPPSMFKICGGKVGQNNMNHEQTRINQKKLKPIIFF